MQAAIYQVASYKNVWAVVFAIALIALNLGIDEWLSAPVLFIAILVLVVTARGRIPMRPNFIRFLVIGTAYSIGPIIFLLYNFNEVHSSLFQLRELTFLALIVYLSRHLTYFDREIAAGFSLAAKIIFAFIVIQAAQIQLGTSISTIPQSWMMLDYGNSLQTAIANGYDYIRPVAFYSEPSVVASVILPAFYVCVKRKRHVTSILCVVTLLIAKSMLGICGLAFVLMFAYTRNRTQAVVIGSLLLIVFIEFYSMRATAILQAEDMSYLWRIQFPIEYVLKRLDAGAIWPVPVSEISRYAAINFNGAAITDTWPIATIARLGIMGVAWIAMVIFFLPRRLRIFFIFLSVVSGAPLYQDKALLMILFYRAAYGRDTT